MDAGELKNGRVAHESSLVPNGRRTRSQAASEASSAVSVPRRSTRLTSTSASSSAEPPERPRSRARRTKLDVRTPSDEAVIAQGGTSQVAVNPVLKAFQDAGFQSISWRDNRKPIATEFAPLTQLAKDIPHELHDRLNSLSLSSRLAGNMQVLVFEAEMRANTAEDEPYAPPIRVVNEVDDEPTPPLEFFYSNQMWHGEGVPKPDHTNLRGCDCVGPCDPLSKTCACVKRQSEYNWDRGGFIYDRKGKLRAHEYPIFECNMNCACSEDCMNRVVQHGRQHEIAICKTPNKGWGVFAGSKKIPANSYIGLYAGEYLTDSEGETRGMIYNKFGRTYLFDLDFWYLNKDGTETNKYCIDAYHAGNNHSCDPNCTINACYINEGNLDKPLLTIFTCRDVEPYEELCFSYFGPMDDEPGSELPKGAPDDAVYVKCQCGAAICRGTMWK
ncbi:SET domain-containing protein [Trametes polyzona]|nr:SET domain-containing protein [Trametes polyzona]